MKNLNKFKWLYRSIAVGKSGYTYYSNHIYFRYPKTYGELKNYDEKYSRRKRRYIPNAWDDKPVREYKSWKHTTKRRKQWKYCKHSQERLAILEKK